MGEKRAKENRLCFRLFSQDVTLLSLEETDRVAPKKSINLA